MRYAEEAIRRPRPVIQPYYFTGMAAWERAKPISPASARALPGPYGRNSRKPLGRRRPLA